MSKIATKIANLPAEKAAVYALRWKIFVEEQEIDPTEEFDGNDEIFPVFLTLNGAKPIATARLRRVNDKVGKIERFGVSEHERGKSVGRELMNYIENYMCEHKFKSATLSAQTHAQRFYEKLGFSPHGEIYEEAGIPHIKMTKSLN